MKISTACFTPIRQAQHIYIAYSGGLDSHVLLHLCSTHLKIRAKLTAVYVHHGLQEKAGEWAIHCQQQAQKLGIRFKSLYVNATADKGDSPEQAARDARYNALKQLLKKDDVLLVAQHRDDQLETVLLQLFRGAGVQGLAAMAEISVFADGQLIRPLLNYSQHTINNYAIEQHLTWITDPSNQCDDFERNFLRNQIVPLLKTHWPALDKTVARSAKHCANAQQLLARLAEPLLAQLMHTDSSLAINDLVLLEINQQSLVIRQWFAYLNLKMPSITFLQQLSNQVIAAKKSANPLLKRSDCQIRRYQNKLYCLTQVNETMMPQIWSPTQEKVQLSRKSSLQRVLATTGISQHLWQASTITIHYRKGGEKIALPNRQGHHGLKKLFQEAQIPPWERSQIPLVYCNDSLIAIAHLWISSDVFTTNQACYQLKWQR